MRRSVAAGLVGSLLFVSACDLNIAGKQVLGHPASYDVQAEFPSTIGLYPGSFVRQLGIDVGSVSKVKNQGDHVLVTMRITKKFHLAADAKAILVGDSVLGERYIQFAPAYVGGAAMAAGTTLGPDRVAFPVETDAVLRSLNTVLRGINPTDIKQFTVNLASILDGQGAKLNTLIQNAAGTLQLLADKGNDLGQLSGTLAALTGQLDTKDKALANLVRDYDLLAQTIAADRTQLDGTITQLTNVTTEGAALLAPNLASIQTDVADLATAGRTLDRNLPAVDSGVKYADRLFAAAHNAYDPLHNWLPLNPQSNPTASSKELGASVRDALSSLCRRLAAKQPGLGSALAACGNPSSGFFDPIIGLLPTLLANLPGQGGAPASVRAASATPASATDAFAEGLAAIPGLSAEQRQALLDAPQTPPAPVVSGPPGAAAVAALAASPRDQLPSDGLAPEPALRAAPHHHRGLIPGFFHWVGGLL